MSNSVPPFGRPSNSSPFFGQNSNTHSNAFGFQMKAPLFGDAPASGRKTTPFGAFGQSSNGSSIFGQTSNAKTIAFGFEKKPSQFGVASTSGTNTASLFGAFGHPAPIFGQSSNANTKSIYHGAQNTIPSFGTAVFDQSKGSRQVAYKATPDDVYGSCHLQSISAMPAHSGKSHEELRFEDYNAGNRGGIAYGFSSFSTMANPFVTQISSSLNSSQTTSSVVSPQNTSTSFPSQITSNSFPSQTTSSPQSTFTSFPSQITSISFPSQATSSSQSSFTSFPSQITSISFPSQTIFSSPQSTFTPFPSQTNSTPFLSQATSSPQWTFTSFPSQSTSNSFPFQTTSCTFPPQTASISFPSQATFPSQTISNPFPSKFPQTTSNLFPTQTSAGWFPPETCYTFSPHSYFDPFSDQIRPRFSPPKTSANPFGPEPRTSINGFPNQSSTCSLSPKIPATAFARKTSPTSLPPTISPSIVSVALPVLNNFKTCTHCSTLSNPSPELSKFPNADQSNSTHYVSTGNPSFSVRDPFLSHPSHSTPTVQTTDLCSSAEVIGPSTSSQGPAPRNTVVDQPLVSSIPFEELPAMARLTISQPGSTISVQYGMSSMPVPDSLSENTPVSRGNLRARVVLSAELCSRKSETEEVAPGANTSLNRDEYGVSYQNNTKEPVIDINLTMSAPDPHGTKISQERMDKIKALMPLLSLPDYYTEPTIKQLAEKEMVEPGFCSRVKDFEFGRYGYGSIKFLGESDVRSLSLDSLVEFGNRKIVVYKNEFEKPVVGKGLNKRAEITLINIQCIDKKTGKKYVEGPEVEKYKEMLIKKGEERGAEFISFDPVKGEWKFRVQHFYLTNK